MELDLNNVAEGVVEKHETAARSDSGTSESSVLNGEASGAATTPAEEGSSSTPPPPPPPPPPAAVLEFSILRSSASGENENDADADADASRSCDDADDVLPAAPAETARGSDDGHRDETRGALGTSFFSFAFAFCALVGAALMVAGCTAARFFFKSRGRYRHKAVHLTPSAPASPPPLPALRWGVEDSADLVGFSGNSRSDDI
jgi:hypothetical protein